MRATLLRSSELALIRLALALGADTVGGPFTDAEATFAQDSLLASPPSPRTIDRTCQAILSGEDPLGETFCVLRPALKRREVGAFYTSGSLVEPMVTWALSFQPKRFVDPGCGSGRFAASAVRRRPDFHVVAIDADPVATLLARATLAVLSAKNAQVINADYLTLELPQVSGITAFVGNPPYVRHHSLSPATKSWGIAAARRLGFRASALAGLHAYFFLATALYARSQDVGCFVTSSEWLDVNYGSTIRHLLLERLGGQSLDVVDPQAIPFDDAMTTAAVACFIAGNKSQAIRFQYAANPSEIVELGRGRPVSRTKLASQSRWSPFLRELTAETSESVGVPLRAVARVHRGVATGANDFFILTRDRARALRLEEWCRPVITSAEEVQRANGVLHGGPERKLLLCVPADVDRKAHPALDAYLRLGESGQAGKPPISERYLPSHRRPWWYLGHCAAAPIVATYMARQPPVFALNPDGLALVNIGHGIFPKGRPSTETLKALVEALNDNRSSFRGNGRTYHGGLEKFEPREMENLPIPIELVEAHEQLALISPSAGLG